MPNTAPIILLVVPRLVIVIEFTHRVHTVVSTGTRGLCAQPGRLQVEPYGFKIEQLQGKPRVPAETNGPGVWKLPAANPPQIPREKNPRIKKPSPHPRRRGQSGYLTSTLGGPWSKKGQKPPLVETSDTPERYYAPFYMERVDVPTPGPGDYDPEHPAIRGRIPGCVPGFPKMPRDENIRL